MGVIFSRGWSAIWNSKIDARILMVGLDASGKTTTLYKLKVCALVFLLSIENVS